MAKRTEAWHDKKWLMPTLAVLAIVSSPFVQDIRDAVVQGLGIVSLDWLFDFFLTGGLLGLVVVLMLKSDRAARACEDLREQVQKDLAEHRKQLHEDLAGLVDPRLQQITDSIATLQSNVVALGSRVDALQSNVIALGSRVDVLDSRITALKDAVVSSSTTT